MICSSQEVETKPASINRQTDRQNVVDTTKAYSSALKRKDVLTPATTWVHVDHVMLSETS